MRFSSLSKSRTFFCSGTSWPNFKEKVAELEESWDSGVPRFAEASAPGWASWTANRASPERLPPTTEQHGPVTNDDPYTSWVRAENLRETSDRFSTRSWNESEEDPCSTVMFLDFQDYLVTVSTNREKECLRLAFLAFLGVPIPRIDNDIHSLSQSTPMIHHLSELSIPNSGVSAQLLVGHQILCLSRRLKGHYMGIDCTSYCLHGASGSVWVWPPLSLGIWYARVVGWHRKDLRGRCMEWRIIWTYCGHHQIVS